MTALFHALIHLARLRWLGAAFCALAMLCATTHASAVAGATAHARIDVDASTSTDNTATASASEAAQTKDRVWGFDQNFPLLIYSLRSASAEQPSRNSPTLPETASGPSNAGRGGGAAHGQKAAPQQQSQLRPGQMEGGSEFQRAAEQSAAQLGLNAECVEWSEPYVLRTEQHEVEEYLREITRDVKRGGAGCYGRFHAWEVED